MNSHATKVAFSVLCKMKTVADVYKLFNKGLQDHYNKDEVNSILSLLLESYCSLPKSILKAFPEMSISTVNQNVLFDALGKLKSGMPVQYILGFADFFGLRFKVNSHVLIPRPETEELIQWVLETFSQHSLINNDKAVVQKSKVLDVGTGSGCIAISLKKHLNDFEVVALDFSSAALDIARENAHFNDADITFIKHDILRQPDIFTPEKLTAIVSNPPYVTPEDKEKMHTNVVDYEPHSALFVPQDDPLLFYRSIADFALVNLESGGWLFFEINEAYGDETINLLKSKGFTNTQLKKDLFGKDRMIRCQLFY
jgi:release factor glutamine methyltransferase